MAKWNEILQDTPDDEFVHAMYKAQLSLRKTATEEINKLDTKQIATILNIEPKSVRMTKYRLKQKFSLVKEDELYTFFHQIIA